MLPRTAAICRQRGIAVVARLSVWSQLRCRSKTDFLLLLAFIRIALMISSRAILKILLKHYIVIILGNIILEIIMTA